MQSLRRREGMKLPLDAPPPEISGRFPAMLGKLRMLPLAVCRAQPFRTVWDRGGATGQLEATPTSGLGRKLWYGIMVLFWGWDFSLWGPFPEQFRIFRAFLRID